MSTCLVYIFKPEEWIKKGKKSHRSPFSVINATQEVKAIPPNVKAFLHLNPHHFLLVLSRQQVETSSNTNDSQLSNDGY